MQLVIAKKPGVAMSIATVIGADERKDGYMEGGGYIVSWRVGHLERLFFPVSKTPCQNHVNNARKDVEKNPFSC